MLQKSSPSSPLAFSLRADLPAGRDRSLCWPVRLIVWRDRSGGEDKGTVRSEPCEKKAVQTTKQDVLEKPSPSSPFAFSLRADLPAGRDRSLCWPARLAVATDCILRPPNHTPRRFRTAAAWCSDACAGRRTSCVHRRTTGQKTGIGGQDGALITRVRRTHREIESKKSDERSYVNSNCVVMHSSTTWHARRRHRL